MDLENFDINEAISAYYKAKFWHDVRERAINNFAPNEIEDLDVKERRLDIVGKKKMLGIPLTDDDYETGVNEDRPFSQRNLGMMAVGANFLTGTKKPLPDLKHFDKPGRLNFLGKMLNFK
jgi:hypothetical protein